MAKLTTGGNGDVACAAHIDGQADCASRKMRVRGILVLRIAAAEQAVSVDVNRHRGASRTRDLVCDSP
jgi:hypothetical protein